MNRRDLPVLEKSRPAVGVLDFSPEAIKDFLCRRLRAKGVTAAYQIGSLVTRTAGPWSDVDLIIVHHTVRPFVERARDFQDLLEFGLPIDLLVYTPEEFQAFWHSPLGFWKSVRENHERLL